MNIKELLNIKEEGLYPTTALLTKLEQAIKFKIRLPNLLQSVTTYLQQIG